MLSSGDWYRLATRSALAGQLLLLTCLQTPILAEQAPPPPDPWPPPELVEPLANRLTDAVAKQPGFDEQRRARFRERALQDTRDFIKRNKPFLGPILDAQFVNAQEPGTTWLSKSVLDRIADRIGDEASERYGLDESQRAYIRDRGKKIFTTFFTQHRGTLDPLVTDVMALSVERKVPTTQWVVDRATEMKPVLQALEKEMDAAYRDLYVRLRPNQRDKLRKDYLVLKLGCALTRGKLRTWSSGGFNQQEWYKPFITPFDKQQKIVQEGKVAGLKVQSPPEVSAAAEARIGSQHQSLLDDPKEQTDDAGRKYVPLSRWQSYTKQFIRRHKLNEGQKTSAMAILKETEERASAYRKSHAKELSRLNKSIRNAKGESKLRLQAKLDDLESPLREMFEEFQTRLNELLETKQRR
jgi:hypothetical protein